MDIQYQWFCNPHHHQKSHNGKLQTQPMEISMSLLSAKRYILLALTLHFLMFQRLLTSQIDCIYTHYTFTNIQHILVVGRKLRVQCQMKKLKLFH